MVVINYKSGMINVFNRKRDMVNKRTAYFRYIRIVNIEENLSITPYVIPILSRIVYKQAS